jgi:hypothetical protein
MFFGGGPKKNGAQRLVTDWSSSTSGSPTQATVAGQTK